MTGRRGRLVRTKDGNAFVYETREQGGGTSSRGGGTNLAGDGCDSVNIKERQAFMDGRKLVGIISDVSLGPANHWRMSRNRSIMSNDGLLCCCFCGLAGGVDGHLAARLHQRRQVRLSAY